ncbi:MAG: hypothetical protein ACI4EI_00910 [Muricoprocola sp.]
MKKVFKKTRKIMSLFLIAATIFSLNIATTYAAEAETDQPIVIGEYDGWLSECIDAEKLSGCRTTTKEVGLSDFDWQMEFVSDENGNILASNSKDNVADSYKNVSCICDENSNISIVDETEGKSWSGKYSLKVSDKGTKAYDLTFSDDVSVIGILGVREYEDGETVYSFAIYTDDKVVSFLPEAI